MHLELILYIFRGFDFANHFVEYSIDYNVDQPPYYELLPQNFPNKCQMKEFMVNYLRGTGLYSESKNLDELAERMVKVICAFHFIKVWHSILF